MLGIGSTSLRTSMRWPSSDQGRYTMSERTVTPMPAATSERTAYTELVVRTARGVIPAASQ